MQALYLDTYNWLHHSASGFMEIPKDAKYPIWVSVTEESKIQNSEGNVLLEILVDPEKLFYHGPGQVGIYCELYVHPKGSGGCRGA